MEPALQARDPGSDLPETIDRYEILQKLAAGGMAELFLAKQSGMEGFEKVVVIKRILTHLATDQEFVSMFLDEARIAAKLSHPNVVQIYDLGRADDTYYIAMEYVSGRNVSHVIKKAREGGGNIPVEHVARVVAGVCDGLFYAHTRKDYDGKPLNIIHRDISPQNILVSFAGGVKLVDFGIAKASTQLAQTRAGVLKGKYSYMSPEQVRGDKIDGRSDIFAVGIVMYEMLTGQRPFERENSLKTLKAIVQEKPLNPRDLNNTVPPEIVKILSKALEKDPNRRYSNAQEMQLALEDWLDRSPVKSNNVRISRYLYELFDDELNAEGGTLEVKGIGEIIIPTGSSQPPEATGAIEISEDEVAEGTIRAALEEVEAAHRNKATAAQAPAKPAVATKPVAPPAKPPVPPPQAKPVTPPPKAGVASRPPQEDLNANTDPAMEAVDADVGEGGATDELDGATIPVYDLEAYEAERLKRHGPLASQLAAQKPLPENSTSGDDSGFNDDAPTMNMDNAMRAGLLANVRAGANNSAATSSDDGGTGTDGGFGDSGATMAMDISKRAGLIAKSTADLPVQNLKAPPPVNSATNTAVESPVMPSVSARAARPETPPPAAPPKRAVLEPPAMGSTSTDDEVVPGLAGGPVRPAASAGANGNAAVRPPAEAFKIPVPVNGKVKADGAPPGEASNPQGQPKGLTARPNKGSSAVLQPVSDERAATGSMANALPVPVMPPMATPAPTTPPDPAASKKRAKLVVAVVAVVLALVGVVGVVMAILHDDVGAVGQVTPPVVDNAEVGRLVVKSKPSGCEIYLKGALQLDVKTSAHLEVPLGPVTVRVHCKDYEDKLVEVNVSKDKPSEVNVVLEKKK